MNTEGCDGREGEVEKGEEGGIEETRERGGECQNAEDLTLSIFF